MMRHVLFASLAATLVACGKDNHSSLIARRSSATQPDELPVPVSNDLPFRYPPSLYARKVQGNVLLRLYVDRDGRVVPDSIGVYQKSGSAVLDSAAMAGAREMRFVPGKLHGEPIGVSVIFPVYYRHPEAPPLPNDTILKMSKPQ